MDIAQEVERNNLSKKKDRKLSYQLNTSKRPYGPDFVYFPNPVINPPTHKSPHTIAPAEPAYSTADNPPAAIQLRPRRYVRR